jgi:putative flippase GtrA
MQLPQALRFVIVGGFNTGVSYAVYALGLYLGLRFELANLLACVAGILVGFRTHARFVFTGAQAPQLWKYFALWVSLYLFNVLLIRVFVELGCNAYVAGALATPIVIATSYLLNRKLVFVMAPPVAQDALDAPRAPAGPDARR